MPAVRDILIGYTTIGGFKQTGTVDAASLDDDGFSNRSSEWVVVEREFNDATGKFKTRLMRVSDGALKGFNSDGAFDFKSKPDGRAKSVKVKEVKTYEIVTEKVTIREVST